MKNQCWMSYLAGAFLGMVIPNIGLPNSLEVAIILIAGLLITGLIRRRFGTQAA